MFKRVAPGQPWRPKPASTENSILLAAEDFELRQRNSKGGDTSRRPIPTDIIKVKNSTGSDLSQGSCVRFYSQPIDTLDADHIWLTAGTGRRAEFFGIVRRAIPSGDIGDCQVSGVCLALVNVLDTDHEFAGIDGDGDLVLTSIAVPDEVEILQPITETGEQLLAVRFRSRESTPCEILNPISWTETGSTLSSGEFDKSYSLDLKTTGTTRGDSRGIETVNSGYGNGCLSLCRGHWEFALQLWMRAKEHVDWSEAAYYDGSGHRTMQLPQIEIALYVYTIPPVASSSSFYMNDVLTYNNTVTFNNGNLVGERKTFSWTCPLYEDNTVIRLQFRMTDSRSHAYGRYLKGKILNDDETSSLILKRSPLA